MNLPNAWRRQLHFPSGGYVSEQEGISTDVRTRDANPMVMDCDLRGGRERDPWGNQLRHRDPVMKARAELQRRGNRDPEAREWWDSLSPAEANQIVAELAAGTRRFG